MLVIKRTSPKQAVDGDGGSSPPLENPQPNGGSRWGMGRGLSSLHVLQHLTITLQIFSSNLWEPKWDRFNFYARRILRLKHTDRYDMIDDAALTTLLSSLPSEHGTILPNLRHLVWTTSCSNDMIPQVLNFVTPSLQSLEITDGSGNSDCPDLECVGTTLAALADRADFGLSRLVVGWEDQEVSFPVALARLLVAQPQLTDLEIIRMESALAKPVLEVIPGLKLLRRLAVEIWLDDESKLEGFLVELADACQASVEVLEIQIPDETGDSTPFRSFYPLLRIKALTELQISLDGALVIEERDIAAMGATWVHMRSLTIHSVSEINPISTLPFYALHFSPVLESLNLNFTLKDRPSFDENTPAFKSLKTLEIAGELSPSMIVDVGSFLAWVCPSIAEIKHSYPQREYYTDSGRVSEDEWKQVMEIAKAGRRLQEVTIRRLEKGRSL